MNDKKVQKIILLIVNKTKPMNVKLISVTKLEVEGIDNAEDIIAYCARVSNPTNQMNTETAPRLLRFLIKHKHWSPFELANMCVEIQNPAELLLLKF